MGQKTRLAVSILALSTCVGATVGTTFALFTSEKTVNNHLNVGSLSCGFYLNELKYDSLTSTGEIETKTEDLSSWTGYKSATQNVDLKVYSGDVIKVEKMCPSMEGYAIFEVENAGDIAFTYTFEVLNKHAEWADQTDKTEDFDSVMTVEVSGVSSDVVKKGEKVSTNKVSFKFLSTASNDWQNASFSFDIQLVATQITK